MRLRYWIKTGLRNGVTLMGAAAVFSLMMLLQSGKATLDDVLGMSVGYLVVFGIIMSMVFNMMVYKQNLPMVLSFGSSRKEAFIGLQFFRLIPMALVMAAAMVVMLPRGMDVGWQIPAGVGIALAVGAVGSGIGMVAIRFGKGFIIVCSAIIGFVFGLGGVALMAFIFSADVWQEVPDYISWIVLAVGIAAHGISLIPERKIVYKYNVKL